MSKRTELQQGSTPSSSRQSSKGQKIVAMVEILGLNYQLPQMSETQKQAWLLTYAQDLGGYDLEQIKRACERYRQNGSNRFMATSGALLEIIKSTRTEPRSRQMRPTPDGGEQPWGGECSCWLCAEKTPRDGFYRAPIEEVREMNYDREQADQHFKAKIEPSKLDPEEMALRNLMINRLVMDKGLTREMAQRRVMGERTKVLYPNNKYTHLLDGAGWVA